MKKKYAEKRISWKKITLALLGLITILALIFVVGLYLWMQTWKTYKLPWISISFPNTWELRAVDPENERSFSFLSKDTKLIDIALMPIRPGMDAKQQSMTMAEELLGYEKEALGLGVRMRVMEYELDNIAGWVLDIDQSKYYFIPTKDGILQLNIYNNQPSILYKLLINSIQIN